MQVVPCNGEKPLVDPSERVYYFEELNFLDDGVFKAVDSELEHFRLIVIDNVILCYEWEPNELYVADSGFVHEEEKYVRTTENVHFGVK